MCTIYGLMKKEDESLRLYTDRDVSKLMESQNFTQSEECSYARTVHWFPLLFFFLSVKNVHSQGAAGQFGSSLDLLG
jgi:hypothetical protein